LFRAANAVVQLHGRRSACPALFSCAMRLARQAMRLPYNCNFGVAWL
jgi:hypothetical protein